MSCWWRDFFFKPRTIILVFCLMSTKLWTEEFKRTPWMTWTIYMYMYMNILYYILYMFKSPVSSLPVVPESSSLLLALLSATLTTSTKQVIEMLRCFYILRFDAHRRHRGSPYENRHFLVHVITHLLFHFVYYILSTERILHIFFLYTLLYSK